MPLDTLTSIPELNFPGKGKEGKDLKIHENQEVTYSVGSDSYPFKVESIRRTKGGYEVTIRNYESKASKPGLLMGHQDWDILWDKPTTWVERIKVSLKGDIPKSLQSHGVHLYFGHATYHYCWEF